MSSDLKTLCSTYADELAVELTYSGRYVFAKQTLPEPPALLETGELVVSRSFHEYVGRYRADLLVFQATKETYRHLAILILASVFYAPNEATHLLLTHSSSVIKHVMIDTSRRMSQRFFDYSVSPLTFTYWPATTGVHPWLEQSYTPADLPYAYLTSLEGSLLLSAEDWASRDAIEGFGADIGNILMAQLLLNASQPDNTVEAYELEGEAGFRGVGPMSAEIRLWLPGHEYWDNSLFSS